MPNILEKRNRFFLATDNICRSEIHPGLMVTFVSQVDLTAIEAVRAGCEGEARPSYTAFVIKAVATALTECPYANRRVMWTWLGKRILRFAGVDIAIAVERDLEDAPMVAYIEVLRNVDGSEVGEIGKRLRGIARADLNTSEQWRGFYTGIKRLPPLMVKLLLKVHASFSSQWIRYRGGACIVSSPAKYGVDQIMASWSHPLGVSFGEVKWFPTVVNGQVVVRKAFTFTLNFDRRIMAGAQAARFFKRITTLLERGDF